LFILVINLSSGSIFLYCSGNNLTRNSNLFKSPYFSLIGNLGNSSLSLLKSITPECCPKAYVNLLLI